LPIPKIGHFPRFKKRRCHRRAAFHAALQMPNKAKFVTSIRDIVRLYDLNAVLHRHGSPQVAVRLDLGDNLFHQGLLGPPNTYQAARDALGCLLP
jgi:hypothetical protein